MNIGGRVKESKGLGFFLFFPLAGLDSFSNSKQVRCTVDGDLSPALDYCCSFSLSWVSGTVVKHHDQKQPGRTGVIPTYTPISQAIIRGNQGTNESQELRDRK